MVEGGPLHMDMILFFFKKKQILFKDLDKCFKGAK